MEVGIVGGGIVGATAAYYLARNGVKVHLFDDDTGQATKAAAGIICPWFSLRRNQAWYQLVRRGAEFYHQLTHDLIEDGYPADEIYQVDGALLIRKTERRIQQDVDQYREKITDSPSIGEIKSLTSEEISPYFPLVNSEFPATWVSGGGRVHGERLIAILRQAIDHFGGTLHNQRVSLKSTDGQIQVDTGDTLFQFDQLLLSVGAWLPELLEPLGYQVDIHPQKGQLLVYQSGAWCNQHWPVVMPFGQGDIIPFNNGELIIGATHENEAGFDLEPDYEPLQDLLDEANQWIEGHPFTLDAASKIRIGTRGQTSDYSVLLGQVPQLANVWAVSGLGSSGLTSGPYIGYQWSQRVLHHQWEINETDYPIEKYIQPQ